MFLRAADAEVAFRRFEHLRDEHTTDGYDSEDTYNFHLRDHSVQGLPLKSVDRSKRRALRASLDPMFSVSSSQYSLNEPYDRADCGELAITQDSVLIARLLHSQAASTPSLHGQASCLDMFVCQPPPMAVKLRFGSRCIRIGCPDGARVRDIVNNLDQMTSLLRRSATILELRDLLTSVGEIFDVKFAGTIFNA